MDKPALPKVVHYYSGQNWPDGALLLRRLVQIWSGVDNMFIERKKECDREIAELGKLLEDQPDYEHRDAVLRDIEFEKKIREIICRNIPD